MRTDTSQRILEFIEKNRNITAKEIIDFFNFTPAAIHRHLSRLIESEKLKKIGRPPKVFYSINGEKKRDNKLELGSEYRKVIEENFLKISPIGEKKEGWEGFLYWCDKVNVDPGKTATEYIKVLKKYKPLYSDGLINGMKKFKETFRDDVFLDKVFYLDFYSIERFGKTKLGQQLLHGKQNGIKDLINEVIKTAKPGIMSIIKKYNIDGVCFVPWTINRKVQFMRELENGLKLNIKKVSISKIKGEIPVSQKSLSKKADRIENAKNTLVVTEKSHFKSILLIDDAVGSGATLNEIARQIKEKSIAKKVIGVAITGSVKGFDVISEV